MSKVVIPATEDQFNSWISTFASVATVNATLLNLSSGQTAALNTIASGFSDALEDVVAEKVVYKSKLAAKDDLRTVADQLFRSTAKMINANPNVSNTIKANLGITISPTPISAVVPPSELVAVGYENNLNKLTWDRNGNGSGTIFMIEARFGESLDWEFVAFTSKTKYMHLGQTPGQQVVYRASSQRGDVQSPPSNTSMVYPSAESGGMTLKAA